MQTQGILLAVSGGTHGKVERSPGKKASGDFNEMMLDCVGQGNKENDSISVKQDTGKNDAISIQRGDSTNKVAVAPTKETDMESSKEVDLEEISDDIMALLHSTFGLPEQDLTDIMEQLGICVQDMIFQTDPDTQAVSITNPNIVKELIMQVHGVDDQMVFLTNDTLTQEFEQLTNGLTEIVSDALQIPDEKITQLLQQGFKELPELSIEQNLSKVETDVSEEATVVTELTTEFSVNKEAELDMQSESDSGQQMKSEKSESPQGKTELPKEHLGMNVSSFVEKLSVAMDGEVGSVNETMRTIVDQIVNQVKIRVMPETTSMELALNPEGLGKVGIHVASSNGVATATFTVQNQIAKEAVESQMIILKEAFAEKGLKVESIEVNVSEFGFDRGNKESDEKQAQYKKNSSRKIRIGLAEAETEIEQTDAPKENRLIDYTA